MILTPDNEYCVVPDACVLMPMPICDTLLRAAEEPSLFRIAWSEQILSVPPQPRYTTGSCIGEDQPGGAIPSSLGFPEASFVHKAKFLNMPFSTTIGLQVPAKTRSSLNEASRDANSN
jgi:hypothetical protein